MKNYVVGIYSAYEGMVRLFKVVAENEYEAVKKGMIDIASNEESKQYEIDWQNSEEYPTDLEGLHSAYEDSPFSVVEVGEIVILSVVDYLKGIGFEWEEMPFYNYLGNIDKMPSYAKLVKNQMGGNYGTADLYVCVDGSFVKKFQYYSDGTALIKMIGKYKNIDELSKLIESVV